MSNAVSSFWQTLVTQSTEATQVLAPTHATLNRIYWDYKAEESALGQTLNVPLPQDPSNGVSNIGTSDLSITDIQFSTVGIPFSMHPSFTYAVKSFEQFNSPTIIRQVFADAAMKAIKNFINADLCSLINSTNFNVNSTITGASHAITTAQFSGAIAALADQRVPVENNPGDMTCLLPSVPYYALTDPSTTAGQNWSQAFVVGNKFAEEIHGTGTLPVAYGTTFKLDQQLTVTGASPSRTFTGALLHRWAIAGVSRPLPEPDGKVVHFERMQFGPVELRVFMSYNHYPKDAWIVTIDAGYGRQVVRPNMGVLLSIAE